MFRIVKATRPLNHKLWTFLFLLSIWAGMELSHTLANDTTRINKKESLEAPVAYADTLPPQWPYIYIPTQYKLVDPTASKTAPKLREAMVSFYRNAEAAQTLIVDSKYWANVPPEPLLKLIQAMRDDLNRSEEILIHYYEEGK